jgi:hypothetical protein
MTIVFSKRDRALVASFASRSFLPSSVSRSDAARWGEVPGVILASNELSSGNGALVESGMTTDGLVASLDAGGWLGLGRAVFRFCSWICDSGGNGIRAGSCTGDGGGGGGTLTEGAELVDGKDVR